MKYIFLLFFAVASLSFAQNIEKELFSSAFFELKGADVLQRICDDAGARTTGTAGNLKALDILTEELEAIGYEVRRDEFTMPGWLRGDDIVEITSPVQKKMRVAALCYVDSHPRIESEVVFAGDGTEEDFANTNLKGKIALFSSQKTSRGAAIDRAAESGAIACLFINNRDGGMLLTGVSNFFGKPAALPAYSITREEGEWLKRLYQSGKPARVAIETNSKVVPNMTSYNLAVTLPGKSKKKILVGGHFDGWDLGTGAIDNGYGIAVIYELAKLFKEYSPMNEYTIEFAWFNAEEYGLWGSRAYAEEHHEEIVAMLNLDMPSKPTGWNVMGYEEFMPFFEETNSNLGAYEMNQGVVNNPWANSDHIFFMMKGIPSFTLMGYFEPDVVKYYHDFGDSYEKVDKQHLAEASAVISIAIYKLANRKEPIMNKLSNTEAQEFFEKHNLKDQLIRQGWWYE